VHSIKPLVVLAACAWLAHASGARAETTVEVLATDPAGEFVTLDRNQNFYVRIGYTTDQPVRIWARPWFQGEEVSAGSNPSPLYSGSGEALGWFFFFEPGAEVDEIRITAGDGSPSGTRLVASYPVYVTAGERPAPSRPKPDWVTQLEAEQERLMREASEKQMSTPMTAGDRLFMSGFMLAVLAIGVGGLIAPVWAMRRWSGGWRIAAAVPLVMVGFVALRIVVGVAIDRTSHNLWPFEILQVGALSLVVMGVLLAARKFSGASIQNR
jgi:hypothetical protein